MTSRRFVLALFDALTVGWTGSAAAQVVDPRLLSTPPSEVVRCVASHRVSRPGNVATFRLYTYHIGVPAFQMRTSAGQTVMTGPPPRLVNAVFDEQGTAIALVDSLSAKWATWTATVEFDASSPRRSYIQGSTVDSAEAMAIAFRLGPKRLIEAGDSAERLRQLSPRQVLDSTDLQRARDLAALLWGKRCQ